MVKCEIWNRAAGVQDSVGVTFFGVYFNPCDFVVFVKNCIFVVVESVPLPRRFCAVGEGGFVSAIFKEGMKNGEGGGYPLPFSFAVSGDDFYIIFH